MSGHLLEGTFRCVISPTLHGFEKFTEPNLGFQDGRKALGFEGEFPIRKLSAHSSRPLNRLAQVAGS